MQTTSRQVIVFNLGCRGKRSFTTIPSVRRIASLSPSDASSVAWFRQYKRTLCRHENSRNGISYNTFNHSTRPSNKLYPTEMRTTDSHNIEPETMSKIEHTEAVEASDASFDSFHYAPGIWNTEVARRWNATSVCMPYPKLNDPANSLVSESMIYELFTIQSLRHVTLFRYTELLQGRHRGHISDRGRARNAIDLSQIEKENEYEVEESSAAKTSNVEYITIKETPRNEYDIIKQLIIWPKALRGFDGTFGLDSDPDPVLDIPWDTSQIPDILLAQHMSIEELRLDVSHRKKTFGTLGMSLHQFLNLKRLAVPRNFLARLEPDFWISPAKVKMEDHRYTDAFFRNVYRSLPPGLEELVVNVDADLERVHWGQEDEIGHTQRWLRDVASHKSELYPSLHKVVLWQSPPPEKGRSIKDVKAWEKKVISLLNVSRDYEAAGIELSFIEAGAAPPFSGHRSLDHFVVGSGLRIPRHGIFNPYLTTAVKHGMLEERLCKRPQVLRLEPDSMSLSLFHCISGDNESLITNGERCTTICIPYQDIDTNLDESTGLELLKNLFGLPSLKAVVLYSYTSVFRGDYPGELSDVECLSVKETSRENDLQLGSLLQIPRALAILDCTLGFETDYIDYELPFDPSQIPRMLEPQKSALERLSFDLVGGRTNTYGTFGVNLRAFTKLKHLAVPQNFLSSSSLSPNIVLSEADDDFHLDYSMNDVYRALPPSIEELVLNVEGDLKSAQIGGATDLHPQFRDWVRDVAVHKQALYPSLRRVVLWLEPIEKRTREEKLAFETMVTDFLALSQDFEDAGIMLEFFETDSAPGFKDCSSDNHFLDYSHGLKDLEVSHGDKLQYQESLDSRTSIAIDSAKALDLTDPFRRQFHYAPEVWDARTVRIAAVLRATSVCMPFPVLSEAEIERKDNSILYDLFAIPSLRHVTLFKCPDLLHQLRTTRWKSSEDVEDNPYLWYSKDSKAGTSAVECLRVRANSNGNDESLTQFIVWPKALRVLDCTFNVDKERPWDPSQLPDIMSSQRASLEQISIDLVPSGSQTFGTLGATLRQYSNLKRLSLPRNFLAAIKGDEFSGDGVDPDEVIYRDYEHSHVYSALPPALEELVLNVDKDLDPANFDTKYPLSSFRRWARDIAVHKEELYPRLRKVMLWQTLPDGGHVEGRIDKAKWEWNIRERLELEEEFQSAGIALDFSLTDVVPQFAHNEWRL